MLILLPFLGRMTFVTFFAKDTLMIIIKTVTVVTSFAWL